MYDFSSSKNKRRKNRNNKNENNTEQTQVEQQQQNNHEPELLNTISIRDLRAAMEVFTLSQKPAKTQEEAMKKHYEFWNTQPVPKMGI